MGKTTCAVAAAFGRAEARRRVLLVSTDPAHSLGDALDRRLASHPRRVPTARGSLHAVELDADAALARWIAKRRPGLRRVLSRGTYLDDQDVDRLLRLAFPGVDELIGLLELTRLAGAGPYEQIVVDTAPTGHTLRLLAMPATLQRIAAVFDDMQAKHRLLSESLGGLYRRDSTDAMIEEIGEAGRDLEALLRDPRRCAFSWVLVPEAVVVEEARDGLSALRRAGIAVTEIVINRVTPAPRGRCDLCERRIAYESAVIADARRAFRDIPFRVLPALPSEPRGPKALRILGRHLITPPRPGGTLRARAKSTLGRPAQPKVADDSWLETVAPPGVRLLLFAGKGGVGKTTCASSVALALADRAPSRSVLLLSADPAHSLADVLAMPLGDDPRPVPGGPPGLRARELDAARLLRDRRERYLEAVDEAFVSLRARSRLDPAFDRVVVEDLIDLAPPGVDELLGILSVIEALKPGEAGRAAYDTVVLDTAPTGHALRLLQMPNVALEWVHAFMALLLKYRTVIGLGELGWDLVAVSRDLRQLEALLRDPGRTSVVVVVRAAELPRLETRRLVAGLHKCGVGISGVIVNAVTPPGCRRCRQVRAAERLSVAALRTDVRSVAPRVPAITETPMIIPPPRGPAELARWRRTWTISDA